jgi:hypothetical protein
MTILDNDVVVVTKVPGQIWEIRYKDENARKPINAKRSLISKILDLVR